MTPESAGNAKAAKSAATKGTANGANAAAKETATGKPAVAHEPIPREAGNVSQAEWDAYSAWRKTLPAAQLAWEMQLLKHLGSDYYFPEYLKRRVKGAFSLDNPEDWGFVTDDPKLPRVLLIGDSISHMYTAKVRKLLKGKVNLHRAPCNCYSTQEGLAYLDQWLASSGNPHWDAIHFSFGYHDRLRAPDAYAANLEKIVARLEKAAPVLIWARVAPFIDSDGAKAQYTALNTAADAVMAKHPAIRIDDLYAAVVEGHERYILPDRIHYNDDGSDLQAKAVAKSILDALPAKGGADAKPATSEAKPDAKGGKASIGKAQLDAAETT